MVVLSGLVPYPNLVTNIAAFTPSVCFITSSVLNALLAYPLTQVMCVLCPLSFMPVLCCLPVHQAIFSVLACFTPLHYQIAFPGITALRMGISEKVEYLKSPLFTALTFNIEHMPSYLAYPDLYYLFCGIPFRCLQSAITPLFFTSLLLCCPILPISLLAHLLITFPATCTATRKILCNDVPKLISPQNTCLPTYPGFLI
jgi:hypothetical protein